MKQQTTLFVAVDGNDRAPGTLAEPLATVAEAQRRVRALKRRGRQVRVELRGGVYELDDTWTLGPDDSGTAEAPVVYASHRGERAVLSGGRRITGWQAGEANGVACWIADLPDVRSGAWRFSQLFVNGRRHARTRWPREGYSRFAGFAGEPDNAFEWHQGPRKAEYHAGDFDPAWRNPGDIKLFALQLWFDMHFRITSVDAASRVLSFNGPATGSLRDETGKPARYYAENIFEQMLEPGDWYVDNREGRLTYIPLPGQTPENTEVVAPRLRTLLAVVGKSDGRNASHIHFENLDFMHAEYDLPGDCTGFVQACHGIPGAIVLSDAEACVLYGCSVAHVAQYGMEVRCGGRDNRIVACDIHDMGAGGIKIGHERADAPFYMDAPVRRKPVPASHTLVSDCVIHDGTILYPSAIGIWIGQSGRNRIRHNHIFNVNYTGISCGWFWGYKETPAFDNHIEYNHIHHINHRRILSDNGGIYTLGVQPGTRLIGNVLHDIDCYGYGGWGFYPDEGSSEMRIENNLVYRTKAGSFSVHYGRDYVCRNNIFALAAAQVVNLGKAESHRNGIFERNVVYWERGGVESTAAEWDRNNYLCRDNLFYSTDGRPPQFNGLSLAELQARGQHAGLVHADPLFAAPDAGDFTMRADSPAFATGFRAFDPSLAGPRLCGTRPPSFADWPHDRRESPQLLVRARLTCDPVRGLRRLRGGGYRVRCTLRLHNLGDKRVRGRLALEAFCDAGTATLDQAHLAVDLVPGASRRSAVTMTLPAGARSARIESTPTGAGILPFVLVANVRSAFPLRIPDLGELTDVATVAGRLAGQPAEPLVCAGGEGGRIRVARVASGVAVWAEIVEADIRPQPQSPWVGSGIEFFVGPEQPGVDDRTIGAKLLSQVYLLPATDGAPACVARQEYDKIPPKPEVPIWSRSTPTGYEIAALLPMELLKLSPEARAFRLEVVAHVMHGVNGRPQSFKLFGAGYPAGNVLDYGHVQVTGG